tara:strand:- start:234 stop:749 length:516 start_codon:yes stop_codon:yes gene_type:complete
MQDHKNIKEHLNTRFKKSMLSDFYHSFLIIPIAKYFKFKYGKPTYLSIIFENRLEKNKDLYSPVLNFTDNSKYSIKTRCDLLSNSSDFKGEFKTITYEIPSSMENNPREYYYLVQSQKPREIFSKYEQLSKKKSFIIFIGITRIFKYLDMISEVKIHLKLSRNFFKNNINN